ncbi:CBO0543 family protein [Aquibacillus salsiterrae]|uniref:Uncharacterized protein n=1 Tax=Aquibacillus salsiterrae TaxID=2950439 RepID=A0A9X4AF39_9BACI|nr:CBO0543 family protein [Aquibacillus salsiterrae]MDC3417592.1 hypothetical protein [Aquibacillus salsiterrae]
MLFLLFSVVVFTVVTIIVPKRINKQDLYAVALFSIIIGFVVDVTLDLKFNLYGYFEPGVQFAGFLPILVLFPASGMLFINFFPFAKSLGMKSLYVICWTMLCLTYEFFSVKLGYFYHNSWTFLYSAFVYPVLFFTQLTHLHLFRRYIRKA